VKLSRYTQLLDPPLPLPQRPLQSPQFPSLPPSLTLRQPRTILLLPPSQSIHRPHTVPPLSIIDPFLDSDVGWESSGWEGEKDVGWCRVALERVWFGRRAEGTDVVRQGWGKGGKGQVAGHVGVNWG